MRSLPDMHCVLDEEIFSRTVLIMRFLTGIVLTYIAFGALLYYREFLYNTLALGLPIAAGIGLALLLLLFAVLIVLGWFARLASLGAVLILTMVCFIFFGGNINKINVALVLLLITSLLPVLCMGAGKYSLDFYSARKHADKNF